jgi:hypothetical protein
MLLKNSLLVSLIKDASVTAEAYPRPADDLPRSADLENPGDHDHSASVTAWALLCFLEQPKPLALSEEMT